MNLGKMKHKIDIQVHTDIIDELGAKTLAWTSYKKLYAEKTQIKGYQTSIQDKQSTNYTYRFKVRYRTDLNEGMRIVYQGCIYDIQHINNINELNLFETHIDCTHNIEDKLNGS